MAVKKILVCDQCGCTDGAIYNGNMSSETIMRANKEWKYTKEKKNYCGECWDLLHPIGYRGKQKRSRKEVLNYIKDRSQKQKENATLFSLYSDTTEIGRSMIN